MPFTCEICYSTKPDDDKIPFQCNREFCRICIYEWLCNTIEKNLQSNNLKLACPNEGCIEILDLLTLQANFTRDQKAQIAKLLIKNYLIQAPDVISCLNCSIHGFTPQSNMCNDPYQCPSCEKSFLLPINDMEQARSQLWIKIFSSHCPQCEVKYEKNQGCSHITCMVCSHQFCHKCKLVWQGHDRDKCRGVHARKIFSILMVFSISILLINHFFPMFADGVEIFSTEFEYNGSDGLAYWSRGWLLGQIGFLLITGAFGTSDRLYEVIDAKSVAFFVLFFAANMLIITFMLIYFKIAFIVVIVTNIIGVRMMMATINGLSVFENYKNLCEIVVPMNLALHLIITFGLIATGDRTYYDILNWRLLWTMIIVHWLVVIYCYLMTWDRGISWNKYSKYGPSFYAFFYIILIDIDFSVLSVFGGFLAVIVFSYVTEKLFDGYYKSNSVVQPLVED